LLQQKLVFHEQLCDLVNIFKMKPVVKLLLNGFFFWKIFSYASCHLDLFIAVFDFHLFTVPVSTRTCLRVEKVQSCHPALLNLGV
jgi:hypothetical protein